MTGVAKRRRRPSEDAANKHNEEKSTQYMKWVQKYSDITETKHGTVKLSLQVMFEVNVSKANRANIITGPVLIQKRKQKHKLQWSSESAREEDEAPLSARVSRDLRSWFIFEPAPRGGECVRDTMK